MTASDPPLEGVDEIPWRRLHALSVLVNLIPRAWRLLRNAWPILLAILWGREARAGGYVDLALILLFFASTVGSSVVHWATLRYRVSGGRLEIRSGLLNRQMRSIDPERIQNVETVQNVFHKLAGLVEVRIETASGREVEGMLSALTEEEAHGLEAALDRARQRARPVAEEDEEALPALVRNDLSDLFLYGATGTRFGAALVLLGLVLEGTTWVEPERVEEAGGMLSGTVVLLAGIAVLTGTWLFGTAATIFRHYGFRLLRREDALVAQEGLLTRRRVELRLSKVQLVTVSEPMVRRWAGFGSVIIETAAARTDTGGTQMAEARVPVVESERLAELVGIAVPQADVDPWSAELRPPHPHALVRGIIAAVVRGLLVAVPVSWWFWPWGLVTVLLVPFGVLFAWLDHRHQGWLVTDRVIVARRGYWHRQTAVIARDKLQSVSLSQGPMRRRWGLARLRLRVAGSAVSLPDLGWDEGERILRELGRRRRATPGPPPVLAVPSGPSAP